jgi:hypothetical protein
MTAGPAVATKLNPYCPRGFPASAGTFNGDLVKLKKLPEFPLRKIVIILSLESLESLETSLNLADTLLLLMVIHTSLQ